jgi:hypothetical protein
MYEGILALALFYGSETCATNVENRSSMGVMEIKCMKVMCK